MACDPWGREAVSFCASGAICGSSGPLSQQILIFEKERTHLDSIPQQLLLQVILILVNAFFAMTEIAVISLNPSRLRMLAEEGDKAAPKLLKLVDEPSGFLSTIQIAITLAGFLSSAFAADNFAGYLVDWVYGDLGFQTLSRGALNTLAVIAITLILSYFTLVLGELTPKRIAMQKPLQVAKFSCGIVSADRYKPIGATRITPPQPLLWLTGSSGVPYVSPKIARRQVPPGARG